MSELDLIDVLEDLTDDYFKKFKWFLKKEKVSDIDAIKESELEKADREKVVDLMVGKYEFTGSVQVMQNVFTKLSRKDLVTKLSNKLGPTDPVPTVTPAVKSSSNSAEEKLKSVRTQFIDRASDAVLRSLLDKLLDHGAITDNEMEEVFGKTNRAEKARAVIDMVRRKGPVASSALITCVCEVDPCLSAELKLM